MDSRERIKTERQLIERAMTFAGVSSNMSVITAVVNQLNESAYQSLVTASNEKEMFRTQGGIAALNALVNYFQTAQQTFDMLIQEELLQGANGDNPSGPPAT